MLSWIQRIWPARPRLDALQSCQAMIEFDLQGCITEVNDLFLQAMEIGRAHV